MPLKIRIFDNKSRYLDIFVSSGKNPGRSRVAQSVEQVAVNHRVGGSSPSPGAISSGSVPDSDLSKSVPDTVVFKSVPDAVVFKSVPDTMVILFWLDLANHD